MNSTRGPDAWPLGGGSAGRGRPRGMGRGLAAIMAVSTDPGSEVEEFRQVAVELIFPNPRQPRRRFDDEALAALAASMESRGMLQPVLVRPLDDTHFELIAGERRWRAAQLAGLETISIVRRELNPSLTVGGLVLTMQDERTRLGRDVERDVREHFPGLVFETVIPRNVRLSEAPSFGVPVTLHDPYCAGSEAYVALAREVAARGHS